MEDWESGFSEQPEVGALEERVTELEGQIEELKNEGGRGPVGGVVVYSTGSALAMILSWSRNASILWCILHGFFSWAYVIYFAVTR